MAGAQAGEEGRCGVSLLPRLLWLLLAEKFLWLHVPAVISVATREICRCPLNGTVGDKLHVLVFHVLRSEDLTS